jgi:hypothetical protein
MEFANSEYGFGGAKCTECRLHSGGGRSGVGDPGYRFGARERAARGEQGNGLSGRDAFLACPAGEGL